MSVEHAFKIALPTTDPNVNTVFLDGFVDTVAKQIVIKDHNSTELFRIGAFIDNSQFYLDASAPDGGNGASSSPFNKLSDAVAAIPLDGKTYNLYVAPGEYNESGPVALPAASNLNIIGDAPANTIFNFQITYTANGSLTAVMQYRNLVFTDFVLDVALAPFASVTFQNMAMQLNRVDNNPSAIIQIMGGIFTSSISGTVIFVGCPILGDVTVNPGAMLYCSGILLVGGRFLLNGNCTLKTLGTLNPSNDYVDGTIVAGNTPTWLTDAASDATFTGSVNKTVY